MSDWLIFNPSGLSQARTKKCGQPTNLTFTDKNGATAAFGYYDGSSAVASGLNYTYCTQDYNGDGYADKVKYDMISGVWEMGANGTNNTNYVYDITFAPGGSNPAGGSINNIKHAGSYLVSCATANTNNSNTATGITHFSPFQIASGIVILPVKLLSLTATVQQKAVVVNWTTATELNNDRFEVQRGTDGKNFATIGVVKGAGTTNTVKNYLFSDNNPIIGVNYYRLRQVDFDGKSELTQTVTAEITAKNTTIQLNSNPVTTVLNAIITSDENTTATISILDIAGKTVATQHIELQKGSTTFDYATENLAAGVYILRLQNEKTAHSLRFVKQ